MLKKTTSYFLIVLLVCASGCLAVRKKFIRKAKQQPQEQVYISSKDYGSSISEDEYAENYAFVAGWFEELDAALVLEGSVKRRVYALEEIVRVTEFMRSLYTAEGKEKTAQWREDITALSREIAHIGAYDQPGLRQLQRRCRQLKQIFMRDFALQAVGCFLQNPFKDE